MRWPFRLDDDDTRPPLAGRLVGLSVGVLTLAGSIYVALGMIEALVTMLVPFLALAVVYVVMFGRLRR